MQQHQKYLDAIRSNVCPVCMDSVMLGDEFMRCGLPPGRKCPIEIFLPQVVEVMESVHSPLIEDYVPALREKVCALCRHAEGDFCILRLQADCPLDRYFVLVAEAIDEVRLCERAETETMGIP
jgi:hypothetical protein